MQSQLNKLVPTPRQVEGFDGVYELADTPLIWLASQVQEAYRAGDYLATALFDAGIDAELTATSVGDPAIALYVEPDLVPQEQGYRIVINRSGIAVTGGSPAGLFYGVCTLIQLVRIHATEEGVRLPHLQILDWPDFPNRGIMLDVSRDKVPSLETLCDIVDLMASLKMNQFQLYTEHTFAYRGHEIVWEESSAITGEEILALDAYCRENFIELVPNQNSFGHMHRWLKHDKYRHLAEVPEGWLHPFHDKPEPYSLCPLDPGSLDLLRDLFDQLLPHFSSSQFNVGLDETFDLGMGRSKEACAEQGTERVYLDFLLKIYEEVRKRGKTMQFWGDIILHRPELIAELPRDVIALEWGYEAEHPFEEHGKRFAEAGISFYVCPGTSSWNTLAGRTDNALENLRNAAVNGKKNGAIGFLNTDWGDFGHMQPISVSFLGYLAGAAYSWNAADAEEPDKLDFPSLLDLHVFRDRAGVMGQLVYDLGNIYQKADVTLHNSSPLFWLYIYPNVMDVSARQTQDDSAVNRISQWFARIGERLKEADFQEVAPAVQEVMGRFEDAEMERVDAELVLDELHWTANMLHFSARLGAAQQEHGGDLSGKGLPAEQARVFAGELRQLIDGHERVWLARHRPGGQADSARWLRKLLANLEG